MKDTSASVRVWAVIPAAGLSRRMGRAKQSMPLKGSTVAATVVRTVLDADISGLVFVTRTELIDQLQLPADPRVNVAFNDNPNTEMIDSIRIGLSTIERLQPGEDDGILVVPADMPTLASESCRACISAYASDPRLIIVGSYKGKRGHPIIFPLSMRPEVDRLEGGLRMLPRIHFERVLHVDLDDPGVQNDVDTPEDYERL